MYLKKTFHTLLTLLISFSLSYGSYAAKADATKSALKMNALKAQDKVIKKINKKIKKEKKNPTAMKKVIQKSQKQALKNFEKRKSLYREIFKNESQTQRINALEEYLQDLKDKDSSIETLVENSSKEEILVKLENRYRNLESEKQEILGAIESELNSFATFEDYLHDVKIQIETGKLGNNSSKLNRSIASGSDFATAAIVTGIVLVSLVLVGGLVYLIASATAAIWVFSPALAILFLLYIL